MASTLRYNPSAVPELDEAIKWYEQKSLTVANRFRGVVRAALEQIAIAPTHHPLLFPDLEVRYFRVPRFPYLILYRIDHSIVVIEGIFHTASDPERWRRRAESRGQ